MASVFDQMLQGIQGQNMFYAMLPLIAVYLAVIIVVFVLIFFMYKKRHELDYRTGIKSGIFTFIIIFIANIVLVNFVASMTSSAVNYWYILTYRLPSAIIGGAFWGAVYVYFYSKIPGSTNIMKSFSLGSIIILLPLVAVIVLSGGTILQQEIFFLRESLFEPILNYVIFGFFLGYFWGRYKSPRRNLTHAGPPPTQ